MPATLWGFPVEDRGVSSAKASDGRRGVALIIAIMIISVMMLFTSDLILSSQVNMTMATAYRDNVKAEFMAKSGMNAGLLLLTSDLAYDLFQAQQDPKATLSDGLGDFWTALNGLPIGGETAEMMAAFQDQFELSSVLDSGIMDQLKLFDGSFTITVADESQKININQCAVSSCGPVMEMLDRLFACPAEKQFLEQKKLNGTELKFRLKDWVDSDKTESGGGYGDENDPYLRRVPKFEAKNAPFDTFEELRVIEGWDEEVHAVFSPYITLFPLPKVSTDARFQVNLNTAPRALLQCFFPESGGDCAEKSTLALKARNDDKAALGQSGQQVGDILRDTLCYGGDEGGAGEAKNRANWFQQFSMVYRIEVEGTVGAATKRLTTVIERGMPDPKKGEKGTSKVLYWKII